MNRHSEMLKANLHTAQEKRRWLPAAAFALLNALLAALYSAVLAPPSPNRLRSFFCFGVAAVCLAATAIAWFAGRREKPAGKTLPRSISAALLPGALCAALVFCTLWEGVLAAALSPVPLLALVAACTCVFAGAFLNREARLAQAAAITLSVQFFSASPWLAAYDPFSLGVLAAFLFGVAYAAALLLGKKSVGKRLETPGAVIGFILLCLISTFLFCYNKIVVTPREIRMGPWGLPGLCFLLASLLFSAAFGLVLLECLSRLQNRIAEHKSAKPLRPVFWLGMAAIMAAGWGVWLCGFWPAFFSPDSYDQWGMALGTAPLHDFHPLFSTLWVKLFATVLPHPALYTIVQVLLMGSLYAGGLYWLGKNGIPQPILLGAAVLFALLPNLGVYAVTIWKDVPFLMALVWLSLLFARAVTDSRLPWHYPLEALVSLTALSLFRHNGWVIALVCGVVLCFLSWRRKIWQIAAGAAAALLLTILLTQTVYPALDVARAKVGLTNIAMDGVAYTLYYDGEVPPELLEEATADRTAEDWNSLFHPYQAFDLVCGEYNYQTPFLEKSTGEVLGVWLRLFAKNPGILFHERMAMNDGNLFVDAAVHEEAVSLAVIPYFWPNEAGIEQEETALTRGLLRWLNVTDETTALNALFWRNGVWIILCLWLIFYNFRQKRPWRNLYFLPMILNVMTLFIALVEQGARFTHVFLPLSVLGLLLTVLPKETDLGTLSRTLPGPASRGI